MSYPDAFSALACLKQYNVYFLLPQQDDSSEEQDDDSPAGIVSFVPRSANKYPKAKKPRPADESDNKKSKAHRDKAKPPQAARTLVKAGELVHVATDVPLAAQHDMFGAVDTSSFQVWFCKCFHRGL